MDGLIDIVGIIGGIAFLVERLCDEIVKWATGRDCGRHGN